VAAAPDWRNIYRLYLRMQTVDPRAITRSRRSSSEQRNLYMSFNVPVLNTLELQPACVMQNFVTYARNRRTISCRAPKQQ
jgi:hypothetical protein